MKPARDGLALTSSFPVGHGDTAAAIGNVGVDVISTMTLVKLVEVACYNVIQPYYETNDATVGVRVALDHIGAAYPDGTVDIAATLTTVEGRRYRFHVHVTQDGREVMTGEHVRVRVDAAKFESATAAPASMRQPHVVFWFDVHSPWCYFASHRIGNMARRHGGTVTWRPVHLPQLMDLIDGRRPLEANENFVRWFRQDIRDHAELLGLPFAQHPDYPLRPSRALRCCLYAEAQGLEEVFVQRVMRAYWAEAEDISDIAVLQRLGADVGLDAHGIEAAAQSEDYKARIAANVEAAANSGLFGVPAMVFEGKLYWGNDRIDLLERHIGAWCASA